MCRCGCLLALISINERWKKPFTRYPGQEKNNEIKKNKNKVDAGNQKKVSTVKDLLGCQHLSSNPRNRTVSYKTTNSKYALLFSFKGVKGPCFDEFKQRCNSYICSYGSGSWSLCLLLARPCLHFGDRFPMRQKA